MKELTRTLLMASLCAVMAAGINGNATAQEKKPAAVQDETTTRKREVMPFRGKIAEVDKNARTLKIGQRTFQVTSTTEITRDGKPATLDAATIGEMAGGSYKDNGGKLEILKLRIGPKSDADAKEDDKKEARAKKEKTQ